MPSVAERPPLPQGKKRRRDDADSISLLNNVSLHHDLPSHVSVSPLHFKSLEEDIDIFSVDVDAGSSLSQKWHAIMPRKITPLPANKRHRVVHTYVSIPEDDGQQRGAAPPRAATEREPSCGNRVLQDQMDAVNRPATRTTNSLAPCNVCHRRPTKKSELDSYADCEGCGHRTCFICMRQCAGWLPEGEATATDMEDASLLSEQEVLSRSFHMDDAPPADNKDEHEERGAEDPKDGSKGWATGGHRGMVCSRCCIEKGVDGDIICLGCLARMEGA